MPYRYNSLLRQEGLLKVFEEKPNLFSLSPVAMYGCVPASTSGLTRMDTGATFPMSSAVAAMRSNR